MAHILEEAYTKLCCNLHGHTYTVEVEIKAPNLVYDDGMILDYGYIKKIFEEKIKSIYDHATMIPPVWHERFKGIPGVVNVQFNPTAENIAKHFYDLLQEAFTVEGKYYLSAVIVKETGSSYARYENAIKN